MLFLPQEKQHLSFFHYLNPTEYYLFFKSTKLNDDEPKKARFTSRSHSQSMENPYHAGKELHGKLRHMDGHTY